MAIVGRIGGFHLTAPVKRKTYLVQLLPIASNILCRSQGRVLPCLDSVLLSR